MKNYLVRSCPNSTKFPSWITTNPDFTIVNSITDIATTSPVPDDEDIILVIDNDLVILWDDVTFNALVDEGVTKFISNDVYDVLYGFKWLDMCESYTTVGYSDVVSDVTYIKSHSPHGKSFFITKFKNLGGERDLKSVAYSPLLATFNVTECIKKETDINKTSECKSILTYKEKPKNYLTQDMLFFLFLIIFLIVTVSIFIYNIVEFDNLSYITKVIHAKFN